MFLFSANPIMLPNETPSRFFSNLVLTGALFAAGCANSADAPAVVLERARILLERDQTEESIPLFGEAIAAMPDDPEPRYLRGLAYEKLDVFEKALTDYTDCLRLDGDRTDALNNKAVVLAKLKRFEEAAAEFTRLVNLDPQDPLAYRNRGLCHFDLEHYDAALLDYDKAIQLAPEDAAGWFQRGNVFLEKNEYPKAVEDYSKAITFDELFAKAWMNRGVARYQNGEKALASADLQKAQALDDNIILPGLDFFTEPTASATQQSDAWATLRDVATQQLTERGFTDVALVREFPSFQCAELSGVQEGQSRTILLTCCPTDQTSLTVPAVASTSDSNGLVPPCTLLVLRSPAPEGAAARVIRFELDWNPSSHVRQSVIVRYAADADGNLAEPESR